MLDLVDQVGANPITIHALSSGFVDIATITAWVTAHSVTTINIATLYDQSPTGIHATQVTLAKMPPLLLNTLNGLPVMNIPSGTFWVETQTTTSTPNPITYSMVAKTNWQLYWSGTNWRDRS